MLASAPDTNLALCKSCPLQKNAFGGCMNWLKPASQFVRFCIVWNSFINILESFEFKVQEVAVMFGSQKVSKYVWCSPKST